MMMFERCMSDVTFTESHAIASMSLMSNSQPFRNLSGSNTAWDNRQRTEDEAVPICTSHTYVQGLGLA